MTIPIQHLTFHCRWTTEARLPDYLGSTLRGSFGWALKRCSCMLKRQQCPTCVLNTTCAYAVLFATELYEEKQQVRTVNARPHPLVFQPHNQGPVTGQVGESWEFSLLVIGRASEFIPHVVFSVQIMGEAGIGVGAKHGAGRFFLAKVTTDATTIFDAATGRMGEITKVRSLALGGAKSEVRQLRVHLHTPLRLKQENKLQTELPFHVLIRTALRRMSALEIAYGQEGLGEPALDYRGLVHRAEDIRLKESTLRWHELQRYSNRQRQKVSLSGLMGTALYEGELAEFVPLLEYASQVHVGKQTLFGLGRVEIESIENAG
jgi:CRISPR/Cas system endoribonuclease Cas6 (RAMP superfamily)